MADSITTAEFKDALNRYPTVLESLAKPVKDGQLSLEDLDKFRYQVAPVNFSKNTGRIMGVGDVKKLLEWKMRHGTFRPMLGNLVASNTDQKVEDATKEAFSHYAKDTSDLKGTLELLTAPLKGIGPATGSLLLAVHDPENIIYFSDELYRWLCVDGKKVKLLYSIKEYELVASKAKEFMIKNKCTPIELEKVAFTLIKESEPVKEKKEPYKPSGLPRGRPSKPDSEKKAKAPPSGRGRGRPALSTRDPRKAAAPKVVKSESTSVEKKQSGRPAAKSAEPAPAPKKRGRPSSGVKAKSAEPASTPKKRGRPSLGSSTPLSEPAKKRGRPSLASKAESVPASEPKKRGRPAKSASAPATPASGTKRKDPTSEAKSSAKRAKK